MAERDLLWFDNPPRRTGRRKLYGAAAAAHRKKIARGKRKKRHHMKGHAAKHRATPHRKRRKTVARKLYGAAAKAHAKRMARGHHKTRSRSTKRRHGAAHRGKRRWKITSRAVAHRAGRQLRYRRSNPAGFRILGMDLMEGAINATEIVLGKAVARVVPTLIPGIPQGGALGLAVQVGGALVAGYIGKFISPNASKRMLEGGLAAPIESFIKSMNLPYLSAALSDADGYYAVGDWPRQPALAPGVQDYVHDYPRGMADDFSLEESVQQY